MARVIDRPILISMVSYGSFARSIVSLGFIMIPSIRHLGNWAPAFYGLLVALAFIGQVGVWHMKRWGVMLYMISLFIRITFLYIVDQLNPIGAVLSLAALTIYFIYYRDMDTNL